jgi:hypothetical protein
LSSCLCEGQSWSWDCESSCPCEGQSWFWKPTHGPAPHRMHFRARRHNKLVPSVVQETRLPPSTDPPTCPHQALCYNRAVPQAARSAGGLPGLRGAQQRAARVDQGLLATGGQGTVGIKAGKRVPGHQEPHASSPWPARGSECKQSLESADAESICGPVFPSQGQAADAEYSCRWVFVGCKRTRHGMRTCVHTSK